MASAERELNGGLGAEPPAGSRGQSPQWGVREAKPPPLKLNALLFLRVQRKLHICPIIDICKIQKITQ